ncbi:FHA domain-containing protein PS1 isoform X2 [Carica papaya]|uniref:FHA domain-containing protein PS1 isoform X2 n=1 Tax=Carica papaya TaxID=3649 RepID=UPI000B8D0009|nr:FHA domain-containing protein PS1 isoform X2 [Carica papaya]
MADRQEKGAESEEHERKIPVFTVMKNGAILKNIFVINQPRFPLSPLFTSNPESINSAKIEDKINQQMEETLIVGRHPDCNIMLTHPSISRFHLQLHSRPSSQKLSVIDLSSVHGTWVSEKRIEPGVRVELKEGDTLRVGGSTRVYRLHWIPLVRAYDIENPFVPEMDLSTEKLGEEENPVVVPEIATETNQIVEEGNSVPNESENFESLDITFEDTDSLFADENSEVTLEKEIPSAPLMPKWDSVLDETGDVSPPSNDHESSDISSPCKQPGVDIPFEPQNQQFDMNNQSSEITLKKEIHSAPLMPKWDSVLDETGGVSPPSNDHESREISSPCKQPAVDVALEAQKQQFDMTNQSSEITLKKEIPSAPLMPKWDSVLDEKGDVSPSNNDHESRESSSPCKQPAMDVALEPQNQQFDMNNQSSEITLKKEILSAPLMPKWDSVLDEKGDVSPPNNDHESRESSSPCKQPGEKVALKPQNQQFDMNNKSSVESVPELLSERESLFGRVNKDANLLSNLDSSESPKEVAAKATENESQRQKRNEHAWDNSSPLSMLLVTESVNSFLTEEELLSEVKTTQFSKENQTQSSTQFALEQPSEIEKNGNSAINENLNFPGSIKNVKKFEETVENQSSTSKGQRKIRIQCSAPLEAESVSSSFPVGEVPDATENKESQTPESHATAAALSEIENLEGSTLRSEKRSRGVRSRTGKPAVLQIQTSRSIGKIRGGNNGEVEFQKQEGLVKGIASEALFSSLEVEEEIYTPDKENLTPRTRQLKFLKEIGKLEEPSPKAYRPISSKAAFNPSIKLEEDMNASSEKENKTPSKFSKKNRRLEESNAFSDKENMTLKLLREHKPSKYSSRKPVLEQEVVTMKKRTERVPFQSLLLDSAGRHGPATTAPSYSSNSVNYSQPTEKRVTCPSSKNYVQEAKRSWTIIVDTTSLLDKESRKSLKLLQGLRGTELVVPRMVIRELDCLKQRGSLFRRTTEASTVLEWIEECMMKTKWWIHVQKLLEDVRPIAPTPPASPESRFSGGGSSGWTTSSGPFSAHGMTEIVSPTAKDHILDCALLYRKMKSDGQLVLLSNDITLKIKAIAEGLICETAEQFRESLVNPFSERFLWAESSPRGLTWSHLDDIVLREKYSRYPAKKSSKGEGAKGLKLILLHNSHYGHI